VLAGSACAVLAGSSGQKRAGPPGHGLAQAQSQLLQARERPELWQRRQPFAVGQIQLLQARERPELRQPAVSPLQ
jgi:hypothetical protein